MLVSSLEVLWRGDALSAPTERAVDVAVDAAGAVSVGAQEEPEDHCACLCSCSCETVRALAGAWLTPVGSFVSVAVAPPRRPSSRPRAPAPRPPFRPPRAA